jgi:hypothetical protein
MKATFVVLVALLACSMPTLVAAMSPSENIEQFWQDISYFSLYQFKKCGTGGACYEVNLNTSFCNFTGPFCFDNVTTATLDATAERLSESFSAQSECWKMFSSFVCNALLPPCTGPVPYFRQTCKSYCEEVYETCGFSSAASENICLQWNTLRPIVIDDEMGYDCYSAAAWLNLASYAFVFGF